MPYRSPSPPARPPRFTRDDLVVIALASAMLLVSTSVLVWLAWLVLFAR